MTSRPARTYAVTRYRRQPDGTEVVESVQVCDLAGLLDLARRVDRGELTADQLDVHERAPSPPAEQPAAPPVHLAHIDGRTVIMTEYGRRMIESGEFEHGSWVWMGAHVTPPPPPPAWQRLGRDIEGPSLWWRPNPAVPAPSTREAPE